MIQILFALLAGILTIAAPCILPMLPILLGTSVGHKSRQRPLLIVAGFITSFAAASLILFTLVNNLGLSSNVIRDGAIVLLALFALFMIWPTPFEMLTRSLSGTITRASTVGNGDGNLSGLILGLVLGIVWTPCAGPVLGAILTIIATQGNTGYSILLLFVYAIGAGIPMLLIAYGSQYLTSKVRSIAKYSTRLQQIFGVLILLLALAMFFNYDTKIQAALVEHFPALNFETALVGNSNPIAPNKTENTGGIYIPSSGQMPNNGSTMHSELKNFGAAPEFSGISNWLNSDPLTKEKLKGKVVLIDFWTYSCINCIRTLPYVTKWYETYKDKGFVVIGVHTPEFPFEKETKNVVDAMKRFGINYPVAQDNAFGTWNAYKNQYWPAEYLIDQNGTIDYEHFGEGNYDKTENAIRELLNMGADTNVKTTTLGNIESPEMYFGTSRLEYLSTEQRPSTLATNYSAPSKLPLNTFSLEGSWQFFNDKAVSTQPNAKIRLHFSSGKVYMVADHPGKETILKITVDGKPQPNITVQSSQLYPLFESEEYKEHVIEIESVDAGLEAFTFTFG